MARFKAKKTLTFLREDGENVIKKGVTFTPDKSMNVEKMVERGIIEEVKVRRGEE